MFVFYFNHSGTPKESFPENFVKIRLDLAEILRIRKLDWHDGGKKGRREGKGRGGPAQILIRTRGYGP